MTSHQREEREEGEREGRVKEREEGVRERS
jgi:hypothetical protein